MIEVILLVLAVVVGVGIAMRMDVAPRQPLGVDTPAEPAAAEGALAAEAQQD